MTIRQIFEQVTASLCFIAFLYALSVGLWVIAPVDNGIRTGIQMAEAE